MVTPAGTGASETTPETTAGTPAVRPGELAELERFEARAREDTPDTAGVRPLVRNLVFGVLLAAVLVNVPLGSRLPLARALPDRQALIVRDGLVLKGTGPRIYVLEDNQRRWISSLDAFEHFGYTWDQVHVVSDDFVATFPEGRPVDVLLKCADSPHIYRLEDDRKHWIRDIATFEAEGHVWDDVETVRCDYLRAIPNGPPIPPDAGTPAPDASTSPGEGAAP